MAIGQTPTEKTEPPKTSGLKVALVMIGVIVLIVVIDVLKSR